MVGSLEPKQIFSKQDKIKLQKLFCFVLFFHVFLTELKQVPIYYNFSVIDGFHCDVIKLESQNSEVLRILIYTRLKTNKK